ncbi:MAG TPA: OmpA family protein [Pricia sp.]|nr:OmpA family protein [Pricia sp.]
MKKYAVPQRLILATIFLLALTPQANGQLLKKLGKAAERAAERTVERRVEKETEEKTDQALDSIFEQDTEQSGSSGSPVPTGNPPDTSPTESSSEPSDSEPLPTVNNATESRQSEKRVHRAPDFEPGAVPLFEDDFAKDAQGDFPAKWDTNGSGEIVLIEGAQWFRLSGSSTYVPITNESLPENYTIEFDLLVQGLDRNTSSQAWIKLLLEDTPLFKRPNNMAMVELSPCPWISSPGVLEKVVNGERQIRNTIGKDYRTLIDGQSRISIAVNKSRMRVWMNDNKLVDVPRLVPDAVTTFKILTKGLRDDPSKDEVYITNFRIGKAGIDTRSKLITEGRLSTTAIQFASGSDDILPESYATIREIAGVLEENPEVKIRIIGHTDAEGDAASNLSLSKLRAAAVKNSMELQYGIAPDRILTDGKGESEPVGDNATDDGKAQNRRVEFLTL